MKRLIATLILLLAYTFVHADQLNTDAVRDAGFNKLDETEKAEIIKNIADRRAAVATQTTPQRVNEWLDIGSRIGQGMAGAAREMGVAVNDFAKTPVGIWTIALITWKFMGSVLVHFVGGLLIWLVGFPFLWWLVRHSQDVRKEYDKEKTDIFGRSVLVSADLSGFSSDSFVGMTLVGLLILGVGVAVMFSY